MATGTKKEKAKCPPNPLPCGCGAKGTQDLENAVDDGYCLRVGWKDVHVVHCSLHAAAPDMLKALECIAAGMGNLSLEMMGPEGVSGPNDGKARAIYLEEYVKLARDTIAKAENRAANAKGGG